MMLVEIILSAKMCSHQRNINSTYSSTSSKLLLVVASILLDLAVAWSLDEHFIVVIALHATGSTKS
jgi:hypothetical protein